MRMWQVGARLDRRVAFVFSLALLTGAFLFSSPPPADCAAAEEPNCNCHVSVGASGSQVCVVVLCDGKPTQARVTGNGRTCTTDAVTGQCCLDLGAGSHSIVVNIPGCDPIIRDVKVEKECNGDIKILPVPVPGLVSTLTEKEILEHQSVYYHDGKQIKGSSPSSVRMVLAFSDPEKDGILTAEILDYASVYPEFTEEGGLTIREIKATLDPDRRSFLFFNPELGQVWGELWTRLDSSMFTQGTRGYQQITGTWDGGSNVKFRSTSHITEGGLSLSGLLFGAEQ